MPAREPSIRKFAIYNSARQVHYDVQELRIKERERADKPVIEWLAVCERSTSADSQIAVPDNNSSEANNPTSTLRSDKIRTRDISSESVSGERPEHSGESRLDWDLSVDEEMRDIFSSSPQEPAGENVEHVENAGHIENAALLCLPTPRLQNMDLRRELLANLKRQISQSSGATMGESGASKAQDLQLCPPQTPSSDPKPSHEPMHGVESANNHEFEQLRAVSASGKQLQDDLDQDVLMLNSEGDLVDDDSGHDPRMSAFFPLFLHICSTLGILLNREAEMDEPTNLLKSFDEAQSELKLIVLTRFPIRLRTKVFLYDSEVRDSYGKNLAYGAKNFASSLPSSRRMKKESHRHRTSLREARSERKPMEWEKRREGAAIRKSPLSQESFIGNHEYETNVGQSQSATPEQADTYSPNKSMEAAEIDAKEDSSLQDGGDSHGNVSEAMIESSNKGIIELPKDASGGALLKPLKDISNTEPSKTPQEHIVELPTPAVEDLVAKSETLAQSLKNWFATFKDDNGSIRNDNSNSVVNSITAGKEPTGDLGDECRKGAEKRPADADKDAEYKTFEKENNASDSEQSPANNRRRINLEVEGDYSNTSDNASEQSLHEAAPVRSQGESDSTYNRHAPLQAEGTFAQSSPEIGFEDLSIRLPPKVRLSPQTGLNPSLLPGLGLQNSCQDDRKSGATGLHGIFSTADHVEVGQTSESASYSTIPAGQSKEEEVISNAKFNLLAMGFDPHSIDQALERTGTPEAAFEYLLNAKRQETLSKKEWLREEGEVNGENADNPKRRTQAARASTLRLASTLQAGSKPWSQGQAQQRRDNAKAQEQIFDVRVLQRFGPDLSLSTECLDYYHIKTLTTAIDVLIAEIGRLWSSYQIIALCIGVDTFSNLPINYDIKGLCSRLDTFATHSRLAKVVCKGRARIDAVWDKVFEAGATRAAAAEDIGSMRYLGKSDVRRAVLECALNSMGCSGVANPSMLGN